MGGIGKLLSIRLPYIEYNKETIGILPAER